MASEQGNDPSARENRPPDPPHTFCPRCRRIFVPTSREQQELEREGKIHRPCKSCRTLLVIVVRSDGGLEVAIDPRESPQGAATAPEGAETGGARVAGRQEAGRPGLPHDPSTQPERISLPRSLARLNQAVRTADEKLGRAISAIGGMHECLEEIQAAQRKVLHAHLSDRSLKALNETVAACRRLEELSKKLEQASLRIFDEVKSHILAPDGLRASLDVYHEWLLERCGDEEQRLKIVERLPQLFDLVEAEWQAGRATESHSPDHDPAARIERLYERVQAWQESVGLVRFPRPGEAFDPTVHDAASVVETDDPERVDTVKDVLRSGYRWGSGGPVMRRAVVVRWVRRQENGDSAQIASP